MKPKTVVLLTTLFLSALPSFARLDETLAQCKERYGSPVKEMAGSNGVYSVSTYQKNGLEVIAVFVGSSSNSAKAGMMLYNKVTDPISIRTGTLKPDEETTLLATVSGKWEPYAPPPTLQGSKASKTMVPQPTQIEKRRAESFQSVNTVVSLLYRVLSDYGRIKVFTAIGTGMVY